MDTCVAYHFPRDWSVWGPIADVLMLNSSLSDSTLKKKWTKEGVLEHKKDPREIAPRSQPAVEQDKFGRPSKLFNCAPQLHLRTSERISNSLTGQDPRP